MIYFRRPVLYFDFMRLVLILLFAFPGIIRAACIGDSILNVLDFRLDPLGNCYYLKTGDIVKLNARGKEMVRYSMKDIGAPGRFDVNNPMRVLVFYPEFAVIRILDNNLVDQSEVNIRDLGYLQPRVIAGTPDQGIWVYDEIKGELVKIDTRLKSEALSVDLVQLLGRRPMPAEMTASQQWIVMAEDKETLVFDQFGTKIKSITTSSAPVMIQLEDNILLLGIEDSIQEYHLRLLSERKLPQLIPQGCSRAALYNGKLWHLRNNILYLPE